MSGARGCSLLSPADGRTLPPLPALGGMGTEMLCHQHMLRSGGPQHPHIPSPMSPPPMLWEFVCFRRKREKKGFQKILNFFNMGPHAAVLWWQQWCRDMSGCSEAEMRLSLPFPFALTSSHPSLHAGLFQPAPLQRHQLEPISAGATCRHGQPRDAQGSCGLLPCAFPPP